jgi:hypothetical protein
LNLLLVSAASILLLAAVGIESAISSSSSIEYT